MRKIFFFILALALCGTTLSLEAAKKTQQSVAVIKLTDAEVLALLTPEERAQWDGAQEALKKTDADKRSAQWLIDRTPGDGAVKLDVSGAHKAGREQMAAAKANEAAANAVLQKLRATAQKRADDIAINGPTYTYEKAALSTISWNDFRDKEAADFLSALRAKNYNTFYFSKLLLWKNGDYAAAGDKNDDLTAALITADGKNYSLLVTKGFSLKLDNGNPVVVADELPAPPVPAQTAIIVAEIVEADGLPALVSLRAVDFSTWKIVEGCTYQLKADKDIPDIDISLADKANFLPILAAQPGAFLFQLSFADAKTDLARLASVLFKDASLGVKGANVTDGDFFKLAFHKPEGAPTDIYPKAVNALWKLDPAKPQAKTETKAGAQDQAKKPMSNKERKAAEAKAKAEQAAAAKKAAEKPTLVLFTSPLTAFNVALKSGLDVGKFEASIPPVQEAQPAPAAEPEKTAEAPAPAPAKK